LLIGCGGSPAVTSKPTKASTSPTPDWLIQTPVQAGFLYGVGAAEVYAGDKAGAASRAKDMARLELVKQVEVNISGETEQEYTETLKNDKSELTELFRDSVKSKVVSFELSHVMDVDSYFDESSKQVSVLVNLDVNKELQSLNSRIKVIDQRFAEVVAEFEKNEKQGIELLRLVASGLVLAEERSGVQARVNVLNPTREYVDVLTPEYRNFMKTAYTRIGMLKVYVSTQGANKNSLTAALTAELNNKGINISGAEQADIRIEYDLSLNNVAQGGVTFVITEGNVFLKDNQGRTVKTIQAKAKGASADVKEAESRSIAKLSQQLGKELIDVLF
jgi:hypothetical protein